MAGIGFELRKILKRDNYFALLEAYTYAGLIGAGPWILSIVGVQLIGFLSLAVVVPKVSVEQFQVSVTYLLASSLIVTGPLQLAFTRYIADRLFDKREDLVLPNFLGAQLFTLLVAAVIGGVLFFTAFAGLDMVYRLLMFTGFILLCLIWIAAIFLSGMKRYLAIVWLFALGYTVTVLVALWLRPYGLNWFAGWLCDRALRAGLRLVVSGAAQLSVQTFAGAGFPQKRPDVQGPALDRLFYNLGIWLDKAIFWYSPSTSQHVIGPLRASNIYDFPIFLAYLSIIPGMAAFLVRIETDFVEYYTRFYDAIREGGSLDQIETLRNEMVFTIRQGLAEIMKIQGLAVLVAFMLGERVFNLLGISPLYLPLLYIDVVAAGLQVALLAILNIFFYLDKRREVLFLTGLFVVSNGLLTVVSILAGPSWYGMGFALSLLIVVVVAMVILNSRLEKLEYETFMLQ